MRTVRHLRLATLADCAALEAFEAAHRRAIAPQRGGDVWLAGHQDRLAFDVLVAAGRVLVAESSDGLDALCVLEPGPPHVALIRHLYTTKDSAGDDLLTYARMHARATGAHELWVLALPGDRAGKSRCESLGLTAAVLVMRGTLAHP